MWFSGIGDFIGDVKFDIQSSRGRKRRRFGGKT